MAGFILQELPEEMTNGKKVVYPKMQNYTMLNYNTVVKHIHDYSGSFSEGIIKGVLDTLVMELKSKLTEGHSIKIDGLGVFSLSLGFDMRSPSEQEIAENSLQASINNPAEPKTKYRKVCIKGINFKPDPELLKEMNASTDFQRMMSEVKTPKKNPHSLAERQSIAQALIDKNGQMTLTDYVLATGLERSAASRELKTFTNDPTSGITTKGSHSHKVWVKKV